MRLKKKKWKNDKGYECYLRKKEYTWPQEYETCSASLIIKHLQIHAKKKKISCKYKQGLTSLVIAPMVRSGEQSLSLCSADMPINKAVGEDNLQSLSSVLGIAAALSRSTSGHRGMFWTWIQHGCHKPCVLTEHLKCDWCNGGTEFLKFSFAFNK